MSREKAKEQHIKLEDTRSPFVKFLTNIWVASILVVALSGAMACSGEATSIWPVFGASNQLLAGLTLLCITLYLMNRKTNFWISLIPTIFMMVMCVWGLCQIVEVAFIKHSYALLGVSTLLVVLALLLVVLAIITIKKLINGQTTYQEEDI